MLQFGVINAKQLDGIDSLNLNYFFCQSEYFECNLARNNALKVIFETKLKNKLARKQAEIPEVKIITLTTDMGVRDHYVASVKGSILKQIPHAVIVDISHSVKPFDCAEAAFYVRSCFEDFPEGTVHVIGVDSEPMVNFSGSEGSFPSIMEFKGHFFVSNDNGFFGAFLNHEEPDSFYRIDHILSSKELFKFPTKNLLIPAACKLLNNFAIDSFASPFGSYKKAFAFTAVIEPNLIKGNVIHIDAFGNLITNIHESLFERYSSEIPYTVYFRNYHIDEISSTYNAVPSGEKVAVFNQNGLLEIAINRGANNSNGGAEKLFGVRIGDVIRVEFMPSGSRQTIESLFA